MSANSLPTNDLNDIQTKNPNPKPDGKSESRRGDRAPGRPATHGLRRRKLFIAPEDHERFIHFRHDMIQEIDPQDHTEHFFAEQIIAKRWLLLHADEAETAAMRNAYNAQMAYAQKRMQANTPGDPQNEDDCYDMAIAATCTNEKVHLVLRYRTTHERALFKFETALRQYRTMREAHEIADQRMSFDIKHPTSHIHPQSPNPPLVRESSLAPTPTGIHSRDHSPAPTPPRNSRPANHLRPIQTNCRNSPNKPLEQVMHSQERARAQT